MTRYTPWVPASCLVLLLMLVCKPPIKIYVFLLFPTSSHSRMGIMHTHGRRSPHNSPKTTRSIPKVAEFYFVRLLMPVFNPSIKISLCSAVFGSLLPHLSLGWAFCTPKAIRAPMAAPKQPEIPLRSLHFALSAS